MIALIILVITCFSQCDQYRDGGEEKENVVEKPFFGYYLNRPDKKYKLPTDLEEISGLSYYKDNQLAAVQDEEGLLYIYGLDEEKIVNEIKFARSGDFEGVEIEGFHAYVTRSDGTLFIFPVTNGVYRNAMEFDTDLSRSNNVEGIAYVKEPRGLLLALKGDADLKGKKEKGKAFYFFDLEKEALRSKPLFKITRAQLEAYSKKRQLNIEVNDFKPSGLAFHPHSSDLYVLSHLGKLLVVTDLTGEIKGMAKLDMKLLRQPEGLCFTPDGTLFIASEGRGGRGYLLEYHPSLVP